MADQNETAEEPNDNTGKGTGNNTKKATPKSIVEDKPKTAFFITPLGSDDSDIRKATNGLIAAVIRPVMESLNIELIPPHEILNPGNITKQIVRQILSADLVIANLTGLNANVMYELAIRHATRKPVIVITQNGTKLPFDIAAERTIFYDNDMAGVVALTNDLKKVVPVALKDEKPDNPIYSGRETLLLEEIAQKSDNPLAEAVLKQQDQIEEILSFIRNTSNNNRNTLTRTVSPPLPSSGFLTYELGYPPNLSDSELDDIETKIRKSIPVIGRIAITVSDDQTIVMFNSSEKMTDRSMGHFQYYTGAHTVRLVL